MHALWAAVAAALIGGPQPAAIDVQETYAPHEPIVATVTDAATVYLWDVAEPAQAIEVDDGRSLHIWAPPGKHKLKCTLLTIDWEKRTVAKAYLRAEFTVEGDVNPPPPPPPPPPKPAEKLCVLVVEEKTTPRPEIDKRPADYFAVAYSRQIDKWLRDNGHLIERRDKDTKVEVTGVPGGLATWIARIGPKPLPYLCLIDCADGSLLWEGPLPATEAEFLKLVQAWGKAK